jgi:hypothetical protein
MSGKIEHKTIMSNAEAFADLLSKMTPRQQEIIFATIKGAAIIAELERKSKE